MSWYSIIEVLNNAFDGKSKTLIVDSFLGRKVVSGDAYIAGDRFVGLVTDDVATILIENPTNSGKVVRIQVVDIDTLAKAYIDIYRDVTVTAYGTELTSHNLNDMSANVAGAKVYSGSTFSNGMLVVPRVHSGGSGVKGIGSSTGIGQEYIIGEGGSLVIQVTNKDTNANDISIVVTWVEE